MTRIPSIVPDAQEIRRRRADSSDSRPLHLAAPMPFHPSLWARHSHQQRTRLPESIPSPGDVPDRRAGVHTFRVRQSSLILLRSGEGPAHRGCTQGEPNSVVARTPRSSAGGPLRRPPTVGPTGGGGLRNTFEHLDFCRLGSRDQARLGDIAPSCEGQDGNARQCDQNGRSKCDSASHAWITLFAGRATGITDTVYLAVRLQGRVPL